MKHVPILALRQERERRGWSRNYIAEQVEVDVITVGRWERGERMPHPQVRQKLCALFEMSAEDLGLVISTHSPNLDDAVPVADPSSEEFDATAVVADPSSKESNAATVVADLSSKESDVTAVVADSAQEASSEKIKALKVSSLLFLRRRKLLLAGLGGLGAMALAGGGLLLVSHASSVPGPSTPTPISMPLSKRSQHLVDPNTDNFINNMAWSPDNKSMAVANGSNLVTIWNLNGGEAPLLYYPTSNAWVNDIAWSKANNIIAAVTAERAAAGTLHLWKFPDKEPMWTLPQPYGLLSVSWSPDGKYLALSSHTPTVQILDPFTRRPVNQYSVPISNLLGIRHIKWSASGTFLACTADDGTAHVWEALVSKPRTVYRGHKSRVIELAWSPDERYVVTGSADKTCQVWEALSGRSVCTYRGHTDKVETVGWSPNGKYIASGSQDHTVHVWEPLTGKLVAIYGGRSSIVEAVLWSVDGTSLVIGTEKEGVEIWQAPH